MGPELRRIEEYYGGLIQERVEPIRKLFRRMAVASVRADLAGHGRLRTATAKQFVELKKESDLLEAQYEKELAALQREKEQRDPGGAWTSINARVEVGVDARRVRDGAPGRVEATPLAVGSAVRRHSSFDVLRRRLVDWECEGCANSLDDECTPLRCCLVALRPVATVECPDCGRSFCRSCAHGVCHICDGPVCPDCTTSCPCRFERCDARHM